MGLSKLEQAQLDLNEAALSWLSSIERRRYPGTVQQADVITATDALTDAIAAFRDLAEARGPVPEHRARPRKDLGSLAASCAACGHAVEFTDNRWAHVAQQFRTSNV